LLQVIHSEFHGLVYCLAIFRKSLSRADEVGQFVLWQANRLPSVAFEGCLLPSALGLSFGAVLKELAPLPVCAKIDDEFILWMVSVSEDCEFRFFHIEIMPYRQYSVNQ